MAKTMDTRRLMPDDFFEIPEDPCVYSVDLVYANIVVATNCQTGQMFVLDKEMKRVDFLYR